MPNEFPSFCFCCFVCVCVCVSMCRNFLPLDLLKSSSTNSSEPKHTHTHIQNGTKGNETLKNVNNKSCFSNCIFRLQENETFIEPNESHDILSMQYFILHNFRFFYHFYNMQINLEKKKKTTSLLLRTNLYISVDELTIDVLAITKLPIQLSVLLLK